MTEADLDRIEANMRREAWVHAACNSAEVAESDGLRVCRALRVSWAEKEILLAKYNTAVEHAHELQGRLLEVEHGCESANDTEDS